MPLRQKISGLIAAAGAAAILAASGGAALAGQSNGAPQVVLASFMDADEDADKAASPRLERPAAFDALRYDNNRLRQLQRASATAALLRGALGEDGDLYLTQSRLNALGGFGESLFAREDGVVDMLAIAAPNMFSALSYAEQGGDLRLGAPSFGAPSFGASSLGASSLGAPGINGFAGDSRRSGRATLFPGAQLGVAYRPDAADCVDGLCLNQQNALVGLRDPGGVAAQVQWNDIMEVALFYERAFGNGFALVANRRGMRPKDAEGELRTGRAWFLLAVGFVISVWGLASL